MKPEKVTIYNKNKEKIVGELYRNHSKTLIIVCHGLANINNFPDEKLQNIFDGYFIALGNKTNASIFSFDFRGYGESDGKEGNSLKKRAEDIAIVIDHFNLHYSDIVLYGFSFGAMSVLIEATRDPRIKKAIVINGFFSFAPTLVNLIQVRNIVLYTIIHPHFIFEIFYWIKHFKIENITIPILIICAERDSIAGSVQSKYLFKELQASKKLVLLPTDDHMLRTETENLPNIIGKWIKEENKTI